MNLKNHSNDEYFKEIMYELAFAMKVMLCKASNQKLSMSNQSLIKAKQL